MKTIILTTFLIASICVANAQSPKLHYQSKGNNVLAINPGAVVGGSWYPWGGNVQNEYLLTYRRIFTKANAIKIGINGNTNNNNQSKNDTSFQISNSRNYKIGVGYERYFALTKAWNFYIGADGQLGSTKYSNETPQNTSYKYQKSTSQENNILGIIGLMVNINNKVAVGLESGYKKIIDNATYSTNEKINGVFVETVTKSKSNSNTYVQPQLQLRVKF
jgi:hypothetical protein